MDGWEKQSKPWPSWPKGETLKQASLRNDTRKSVTKRKRITLSLRNESTTDKVSSIDIYRDNDKSERNIYRVHQLILFLLQFWFRRFLPFFKRLYICGQHSRCRDTQLFLENIVLYEVAGPSKFQSVSSQLLGPALFYFAFTHKQM